MTNSNGQTNLGFNKLEIRLMLDALAKQDTERMTDEGKKARMQLIQRMIRSENRLVEPDFWNAYPWTN